MAGPSVLDRLEAAHRSGAAAIGALALAIAARRAAPPTLEGVVQGLEAAAVEAREALALLRQKRSGASR